MVDMHTSLTGPLMIEVVVTDMVSVVCLFCHDMVLILFFLMFASGNYKRASRLSHGAKGSYICNSKQD